MQRRNFIASLPVAGFALTHGGSVTTNDTNDSNNTSPPNNKNTIEKVKRAMLSMQRAVWEQGVAMQAMLELGETELVILMAKDAVVRQSRDGRLAMLGEEFALSDACSPGEALLWAANKTGDPVLMKGFEHLLDYVLQSAPRNKDGIIYHFTNIPQVWSDSMYMLPPFLAIAGKYNEAIKQIDGAWSCLWNNDKKLLSHMWDCDKQSFARKDCWGVGNGWSAAGLTRVICSLPDSMQTEKKKLIGYTQDILEGCLTHMRGDGLFHNIVDDARSFIETNLSQMLAYTIYRGVKGEWIDKRYIEKADKMRAAANSKIDALGLVQGVCGSPEFDHPGTATEGQAFFIMMEVAYNELSR